MPADGGGAPTPTDGGRDEVPTSGDWGREEGDTQGREGGPSDTGNLSEEDLLTSRN